MTAHENRVSYLTPDERETTIATTDGDDLVRIWSAQRRHITRMRKNSSFTEVATGFHGTSEWAEFTIPAREWNPASGAKRKVNLTEAQRQERAERLAAMRKGSR